MKEEFLGAQGVFIKLFDTVFVDLLKLIHHLFIKQAILVNLVFLLH